MVSHWYRSLYLSLVMASCMYRKLRTMSVSLLLLFVVLASLTTAVADTAMQNRLIPAAASQGSMEQPLRDIWAIEYLTTFAYHHVNTLLLNLSQVPAMENATKETVAAFVLMNNTPALQVDYDVANDFTVLEVDFESTIEDILRYARTNRVDVIEGPVAAPVLSSVVVLDPINITTNVHIPLVNTLYLFPTLEQQHYVYASFLSEFEQSLVHAVYFHDSFIPSINNSLVSMLQSFNLTLTSTTKMFGRSTDVLPAEGSIIVVGLRESDIVGIVDFLDNNPSAIVFVTYDEYTLLYQAIFNAFGPVYRPSMDRFLFATNLPMWFTAPNDGILQTYLECTPLALDTPASTRAYYAHYFIATVAAHTVSIYDGALADTVYSEGTVFVGSTPFGPFRRRCPYPSNSNECLINYGAQDIYVYSMSNVIANGTAEIVYGPVTPPVDFSDLILKESLDDEGFTNYTLVMVSVGIVVMSVMLVMIVVSFYLGWFDSDSALVTAVSVRIEHKHQLWAAVPEDMERVMERFSDDVATLQKKYDCIELESTSGGFVVVMLSASDAVMFSCELVRMLAIRSADFPVEKVMDLRIGMHSAACNCLLIYSTAHLSSLTKAVAPVSLLSGLVACDICKPGEVMMTEWTAYTLPPTTLSMCGDVGFVRHYQLDDIDIPIGIYRVGVRLPSIVGAVNPLIALTTPMRTEVLAVEIDGCREYEGGGSSTSFSSTNSSSRSEHLAIA